MKRPTIAQLQAEIEALKQRIAQLEARPAVVPLPYPVVPRDLMPSWQPYPALPPSVNPVPEWPGPTIICKAASPGH